MIKIILLTQKKSGFKKISDKLMPTAYEIFQEQFKFLNSNEDFLKAITVNKNTVTFPLYYFPVLEKLIIDEEKSASDQNYKKFLLSMIKTLKQVYDHQKTLEKTHIHQK